VAPPRRAARTHRPPRRIAVETRGARRLGRGQDGGRRSRGERPAQGMTREQHLRAPGSTPDGLHASRQHLVGVLLEAPINPPYIWDLAPPVSAIQRLLDLGLSVYLADWTLPGTAERDLVGTTSTAAGGPPYSRRRTPRHCAAVVQGVSTGPSPAASSSRPSSRRTPSRRCSASTAGPMFPAHVADQPGDVPSLLRRPVAVRPQPRHLVGGREAPAPHVPSAPARRGKDYESRRLWSRLCTRSRPRDREVRRGRPSSGRSTACRPGCRSRRVSAP
jgi:hypothetical protein